MLQRAVRLKCSTVAVVLSWTIVAAQRADTPAPAAYRADMVRADQRIQAEVSAHSELVKNLEYLTTQIGPRLTGSAQMEAAAQWALQRFRDYGVDAHLETMRIAHAWYRGDDRAAIVSPIQRRIDVRSLGWSKATPGEVTAPVVYLPATSPRDIAVHKEQLAGAIVLLGPPADSLQPRTGAENAYDAVIPAPRSGATTQTTRGITAELIAAAPAVVLRDSNKVDSLFGMGAIGQNYDPSPVPVAFLTHEDYSLIHRLVGHGSVRMTINLTVTFSQRDEPASIVAAEIKGSGRPNERVVLAAHLDSWDLGEGALDNGTGAMATLEAARVIKALGWRPRRTLTFLLFPGEEQGHRGSLWYVARHAEDMASIDAVLVHDTGTGRVFSIALEGLSETSAPMTRVYEPLQRVFDLRPLTLRTFTSSDHMSFLDAGVPAYFCVQNPAGYGEAHHSQTDTFDKVIPEDINQGAAVLAAWAWNVSELTESIPHRRAGAARQ